MSSEVDICNLALSHLGDEATVASIDPPEGSAQADHCARWYPIARDQVLESYSWLFAMRRINLAQVGNPWTQWRYAYAQPDDCLKVFAILPQDSTNDYSVGSALPLRNAFGFTVGQAQGYVPQDFTTETDENGNKVIYTNVPQAIARYVARVEDPTKFSPIFVQALSRLLASYLAGPVIKGQEGAQVGASQFQAYLVAVAEARKADAMNRQVRPEQVVPWMAGR